jgi:hypothetical protein
MHKDTPGRLIRLGWTVPGRRVCLRTLPSLAKHNCDAVITRFKLVQQSALPLLQKCV